MKNIVGVRFKRPGKIYFFDSGNLKLNYHDKVIVEMKDCDVNTKGKTIYKVGSFLELIDAFNQKLFENVYPYLSDEIKTSFENGNSHGR